MSKVLIVYSTRKQETRKIADLIAEGIRFSGIDVTLSNANDMKNEKDIMGYDGYVFGSPTYHGEMTDSMKTFLFLAEKIDLSGKPGGAFGAFGWSGEAPDRIFDTMANIFHMNMVSGPLLLKASHLEGGIKMAQDYGRDIAQKIV